MTTFTEFEYPSNGGSDIHAYRWAPKGKPIAVLQLVHGIAEHMLRYDGFARRLNDRGVLVVAEDHMGHGKSGGERMYFSAWTEAVDDTYALLRRTQEEFPDVPYFLFGHSMGSFMARTLLFRYPQAGLRGAVICGTGWQPTPVLLAGRALCALEKCRLGATKHSPLLEKLMFGAYNAKFKDAQTPNDWICARRETVDRYVEDPLCGEPVTVGLAQELMRGLTMIQKRSNRAAMPKDLPVLFVAGESDPVGSMGKGVKKTAEKFRAVGMQNVTLRLFHGRHEILNEENFNEVQEEIWQFLEKLL